MLLVVGLSVFYYLLCNTLKSLEGATELDHQGSVVNMRFRGGSSTVVDIVV